jgi:hypothetical protein
MYRSESHDGCALCIMLSRFAVRVVLVKGRQVLRKTAFDACNTKAWGDVDKASNQRTEHEMEELTALFYARIVVVVSG